ncbi:MAG: hypothetical protein MUD16_10390 [Desulfobacterales bacterium]|jgi:hypothetical protein|nr:hypothetical protein [Desulfobacterales bacterium]
MARSSAEALNLLNSILEFSPQRMVSGSQVVLILDALAAAQDPALVARFPAVLAICARRGIELDSQGLFARYWGSNPKRQNLEKLLFVSAELFRREKIPAPGNLLAIADGLASRHVHLVDAEAVALVNGPTVAVAEMLALLRTFAADLKSPAAEKPSAAAAGPIRRRWSPQLNRILDLLFPDKQKELVCKRLQGVHLTKTEREYYSRVVKKKLAAIADAEMQELARLLVQRPSGRRAHPP